MAKNILLAAATCSKKSKRPEPSIDYLRECFDCDPVIGLVVWRERPLKHFQSAWACKVWNAKYAGKEAGSLEKIGYRQITLTIDGSQYILRAHRVILALHTGNWPSKYVDHHDGNKSNSSIANLRDATPTENIRNSKTRRNSSTGLKGVESRRRKFRAVITISGKKIHLGTFKTPEAAHEAYRVASTNLFGAFARSS